MSTFEKHRFESERRKSLFYKLVFANLFIEMFSIFATLSYSLYNVAIPLVAGTPVFLFYIIFFMICNTLTNFLLDLIFPYILWFLQRIAVRLAQDQEYVV